jgi:hypothetical protein
MTWATARASPRPAPPSRRPRGAVRRADAPTVGVQWTIVQMPCRSRTRQPSVRTLPRTYGARKRLSSSASRAGRDRRSPAAGTRGCRARSSRPRHLLPVVEGTAPGPRPAGALADEPGGTELGHGGGQHVGPGVAQPEQLDGQLLAEGSGCRRRSPVAPSRACRSARRQARPGRSGRSAVRGRRRPRRRSAAAGPIPAVGGATPAFPSETLVEKAGVSRRLRPEANRTNSTSSSQRIAHLASAPAPRGGASRQPGRVPRGTAVCRR